MFIFVMIIMKWLTSQPDSRSTVLNIANTKVDNWE